MEHTLELLPTLSLELILAPQDSRYSTMAVWPVLVATCKGVLYNCSADIDIHCDWVICMQIHIQTHKGPAVYQYKAYSMFTDTQVMHIHLISSVQVSPVALQGFDDSQASPSAGPV